MSDETYPLNENPLADALRPVLRPTIDVVAEEARAGRRYRDEDFPMAPGAFDVFRRDVRDAFLRATRLAEWVVESGDEKRNVLDGRFQAERVDVLRLHGIEAHVYVVTLDEPPLGVPVVLCLPEGEAPAPGVCCYSGHTPHGLRQLVLDLDSYQAGIAVRLAQAGFATAAVEKVDTGYLARAFGKGVDEPAVATHNLMWGRTTRAVQLKACLAACELLATSLRVDEKRIGATGVSLGGWLSAMTALMSDRIRAVADFGRKTAHLVPEKARGGRSEGCCDYCHILPGMLSVCDRNLIPLACAPTPMLAGHGRADAGSHEQAGPHFRDIYAAQYAALGVPERYEYVTHDGGDVMPPEPVIDYFRRVFGAS